MKFLLDTDICIYLIRKKPLHVLERFQTHKIGDLGISAITFSELSFGAENSLNPETNHQRLLEFVAPLEIEDYPADAASSYARLRSTLVKKGLSIGPLDLLIAAHAVHRGIPLVTNNTAELSRINELRIENWVQD